MSSHRPVRLPPQEFSALEVPVTAYAARMLWRIHDRGQSALVFTLNPSHRFSHADCPAKLLYLGEDLSTCLWERFGDDILDARLSLRLWSTRARSQVTVPELRLCDLTDELTRSRAKVDVSALTHTDLSVPQAWGLAIQRHPANFDGLRYGSRFDNRPCLALFGRAALLPQLRETPLGDLVDASEADAFLEQHRVSLI